MPKTKLDKAFSNSTKATTTQKPATESIMDDFQVPDDLRKQLGYTAQQKKRQLAVEHAEKKLTERLAAINIRLKEDNVKVSIVRSGDSLALQATLPLKPDEASKDGNPNKQTKISLGIPFNLDGLKTAEEEARELGKLIARKTFEWNEKYLRTKAPKPEVVKAIGELLEEFEKKYFESRRKDRQSKNTLGTHLFSLHKYLSATEYLNGATILNTINKTDAGTASRVRLVDALSIFCNTFDFKFDFRKYRKGYVPKERNIPTDEEIEQKFHNFKPNKHRPDYQWQAWQWAYGMLATYGLRTHEVFAIHVESFIDPANTLHELRLDETTTEGVKTGERTIFPLHPHWVELFDLKNVRMPITNANFHDRTGLVSDNFERKKIGFPPYNLRHRYAIRGHELGIPIKEMADNMGHSVEMHTNKYHKYMTIDSRRIVYQKAIAKADETRNEQEAIEVLKAGLAEAEAEIATLKAENEQLRALLTEHQLEGLLANQ